MVSLWHYYCWGTDTRLQQTGVTRRCQVTRRVDQGHVRPRAVLAGGGEVAAAGPLPRRQRHLRRPRLHPRRPRLGRAARAAPGLAGVLGPGLGRRHRAGQQPRPQPPHRQPPARRGLELSTKVFRSSFHNQYSVKFSFAKLH